MNTDIARQFWIRSPGQGEIVHAELPPRRPGEVLVRTRYSGISRGTEALVFRGGVPESQFSVMRAPFQEGEFPGPVKYGYSSVGEVLEGPVQLVGRDVFCLYPHQDLYCVPSSAVTPLPEGVPPSRAVLAANAETALNAVWDAVPGPGDRIVVVGAGIVGLLIAWICHRIPGTEVLVLDIDPGRQTIAQALGLTLRAESPPGHDADLVVHASGHPEGLVSALGLAGLEAKVVEVSWYGDRDVSLPLGEGFHSRRLTLLSSQVGRIPPHRAARWDHRRRLTLALGLLTDPVLDALVAEETPFEELPALMERLSREPGGALCHRIRYPTE